jgi:hypothetical protein
MFWLIERVLLGLVIGAAVGFAMIFPLEVLMARAVWLRVLEAYV